MDAVLDKAETMEVSNTQTQNIGSSIASKDFAGVDGGGAGSLEKLAMLVAV